MKMMDRTAYLVVFHKDFPQKLVLRMTDSFDNEAVILREIEEAPTFSG